jgi:Ca-activated chloride channel homolog
MKKLFDPHRHKLSEGEKEYIWHRIVEPEDLRARRSTHIWRRWGYSSAVVLAALLVAILWQPESNIEKMHLVPVPSEIAPQAKVPGAVTVTLSKPSGSFDEVNVEEATYEMKPEGMLEEPPSLDVKAFGTADEIDVTKKSAAPAGSVDGSTVATSEPVRWEAAGVETAREKAADSHLAMTAVESEKVPTLAEIKVDPAPVQAFETKSAKSRRERPEVFGSIRGVVVDAKTGQPLPYAGVVVVGTDFGTMSLEDGSFKLLLPPGTYTLKCLYMGYEDVLAEGIQVWEGYADSLQFAMAPTISLTIETIEVEGEAATIDVRDTSGGKIVTKDELKNFAVDNVKEAKALEAGIVMQGGELHIRSGRAGEVTFMIDGVPMNDPLGGRDFPSHRRRPSCWVPPYYNNPNGEVFDAMYFEHYGTNPFVMTDEDAFSTFALDVDNASYTLTRNYLERGQLPPKDAVRVEEFVNYFEQGYSSCEDETFCVSLDGAPSPFGEGYHLLRVGVQTREISDEERLPANLIFVIDTSGSMDRENRLGLVKRALFILLDELEESDSVGIIEYGSHARVVLKPTAVEDRRRIERALNGLAAGGSTNAEAGLWLGYEMAAKLEFEDSNTRIILCSDGVANTGQTQAEKILDRVRLESDRGIALSSIGFGMGNYNDVLMEKLADKGDGNYYYVDEISEAKRVFRENLNATLQIVARDAKVQVDFDPEQVLRWRLIGYENRDIADEDFRDDSVDAGELGSGHQATALYEIKLSDEAEAALGSRRGSTGFKLGEVFLRYEHPRHSKLAGLVEEQSESVELSDLASSFKRADRHLRLDALVAEFAEILRGSYWARDGKLENLLDLAKDLRREFRHDEQVEELHDLIQRAARLDRDKRD